MKKKIYFAKFIVSLLRFGRSESKLDNNPSSPFSVISGALHKQFKLLLSQNDRYPSKTNLSFSRLGRTNLNFDPNICKPSFVK